MKRDFTGIPTLFSNEKEFSNEKVFTAAKDKASVLNNHFQSVFTSEDLYNIPSYHSSISSMSSTTISTEGIEAISTKN